MRACVGKEDGTSNLILQGLARVRFTGFAQEKPFRIAEIEEIKSADADSVEAEALAAKVLELCQQFKERGMEEPGALDAFLAQLTDPDRLADLIAHRYVGDAFARQHLLQEPSAAARFALAHPAVERATGVATLACRAGGPPAVKVALPNANAKAAAPRDGRRAACPTGRKSCRVSE